MPLVASESVGMTPLTPGPELDARIAEHLFNGPVDHVDWYWWKQTMPEWPDDQPAIYAGPTFSSDDATVGMVLDTLVERNHWPMLVGNPIEKTWALALRWAVPEHGDRWQPTRCLATSAAVLALMEESG